MSDDSSPEALAYVHDVTGGRERPFYTSNYGKHMDNKATKSFHLKFQQLVLFTIYPQMSCLGLNFLMSNIYFTHIRAQITLQQKSRI